MTNQEGFIAVHIVLHIADIAVYEGGSGRGLWSKYLFHYIYKKIRLINPTLPFLTNQSNRGFIGLRISISQRLMDKIYS